MRRARLDTEMRTLRGGRALDAGTFGSGDKDEMFETVERVRDGFAQMINAQTDEIAITKNVSEGLNAIIAALI